jgi:hypothetical protein
MTIARPAVDASYPCMASRCMAWRWENWCAAKVQGSPPDHYGYCGMAGEPK